LPSTSKVDKDFLEDALKSLSDDERDTLQKHSGGNISLAVQSAYNAAQKKKSDCAAKTWPGLDKLNRVAYLLGKLKGLGDVAADIDPIHIGLPWAGIRLIMEVVVAGSNQMTALGDGMEYALRVVNELRVYFMSYQKLPPGPATKNLRQQLILLYVRVLRFFAEALRFYSLNKVARAFDAIWTDSDVATFGAECASLQVFVSHAALNCDRELRARESLHVSVWFDELKTQLKTLEEGVQEIQTALEDVQMKLELDKLRRAQGATFDSLDQQYMSACLPGTRVELLDRIAAWDLDPKGKPIFWLCGMAGTGKFTISRSVAINLKDRLGANFFFKHGHADRGNAGL
jgi:hypothetical protein